MNSSAAKLISPYSGEISDSVVLDTPKYGNSNGIQRLPKILLTNRSICDFELIANGGFSPIKTFMAKADYESVVEDMRMADGTLFPIPITLSAESLENVKLMDECALIDRYNNVLGTIRVEEIYESDPAKEARLVLGTEDHRHPLVQEMQGWGKYNVSGKLTIFRLPQHFDFNAFRLTPQETRIALAAFGCERVVAFQTRNPLHRAHEEMTKRAAKKTRSTLLLQPVIGMTQPGDIEYFTRVRSYISLVEHHYKDQDVVLSLLPLAMRMAGPREALWHAIIRRNFGANHFIVGRYHASPTSGSPSDSFYGEYEAHELMLKHEEEIGVKPLLFSEMVYLPDEGRYEELNEVSIDTKRFHLSGGDIRRRLENGEDIPEWYLRADTKEILIAAFPPKKQLGFCVWFTGLSGAGKSTIANILIVMLLENGRKVSLLDGDNVRINLSKGLGFSKEDRDVNIRRIGFVASEIVKHQGVAICAAISPYRAAREECRQLFPNDAFIEVFVDTPLAVCEARDPKGLYSQARNGQIKNFTGIDDPYEAPADPEIRINTTDETPESAAEFILSKLIELGFV